MNSKAFGSVPNENFCVVSPCVLYILRVKICVTIHKVRKAQLPLLRHADARIPLAASGAVVDTGIDLKEINASVLML